MIEQWKELKKTIIEMRDNGGIGTQQEVCKFLANMMDILEKQMQESNAEQFAKWVATEIFDDNWEYNKNSFEEIACRKLAKLGIVRSNGHEWELVDPQENEETVTQNASVLKKTYEKEDYYDALETAYEKGYYDALIGYEEKRYIDEE